MKLKHEFNADFFEESTAEFLIDRDRKRVWAVLLDMLAEFDRVCRKHDIKYSIDGGTMLGKVRHNGIIPWDDDIDVIIMRSEYKKLQKVALDEFKDPYFLQTMESDPDALWGHPKIRNSSTTMILGSEIKDGKVIYKTYNHGVFLDIFVLDAVPDGESERNVLFGELKWLRCLMRYARYCKYHKIGLGFTPRKVLDLVRALRMKWNVAKACRKTKLDPIIYLQQKFEETCQRYNGTVTKYVSHLQFEPDPKPSRIFERLKIEEATGSGRMDVADVDFMGLKVMMVKAWDYYLSHLYGNWRKYVVGGGNHSVSILDLDKPYTEYL